MGSNREMIDAFVSGQLSEADHDLMAHHVATCEQCAAAVAAERAVRGELAKLLVQPGAIPAPSAVVSSADLSVPPVPELQLDFVLDRTSEAAGLLLTREPVREVALDQLPPAPPHSERRAERGDAAAGASIYGDGELPAGENPRVAYADDIEVAAATAAGIADSVAHAAAALASSSQWVSLEIEEHAEPAESAPVVGAGSLAIEEEVAVAVPDTVPEEFQAPAVQQPPAAEEEGGSLPIGETAPIPEVAAAEVEDVAVEEESVPVGDVETVALTVVPRDVAPQTTRMRMWGVAAAVLVIVFASVYAAGQLRSGGTGVATAGAGQLQQVVQADAALGMTPSILVPILDSAVYNRVIDVPAGVDSLADSADTTGGAGPAAREGTAQSASPAGTRPVRSPRRPRPAERLPEIVSDPPEADDPPPRPPPGETLPEVMRGNAPSRTTTRGSAVVISGVPDLPRLLRTTTHRPRPEVAYVLREYDASAAEPTPRAGVNEYRWSDATGSRLFVLSGPVDVAELRAYARELQTR